MAGERPKDYSFEALAEVTSTDMNGGRGELNVALKLIREQEPDLADDNFMLSEVIRARAKMYRAVMGPEVLLTPTALAKHWQRVFDETESRKTRGTNVHAPAAAPDRVCDICGGDLFVVVGTRPTVTTAWMEEHKITAPEGAATEEVAPCPDPSHPFIDTSFRRPDGRKIECPDPQRVRLLMSS